MVKKAATKRKKADKAKVQLKGKKAADLKLAKGLNVTKAEVKTKTIVVQNQLRKRDGDGEDQVTTRKKLGLSDLLPKVANLSVSTRVDGLEGLMELLQGHPEILEANSSLILNQLLPLLAEREAKVRSVAGKILQLIFGVMCVNAYLLEPLYDVICVHLCCALSHIDVSVQRGALRVLDTVIECLPELVRRHSDQVLPNCLSQIAVKGGKLDSAMNDGVTSVQRRSEVINRIVKLLKILEVKDTNEENVDVVKVNFEENSSTPCCPLFPQRFDLTLSNESKTKKSFRMEEFLEGMVPVLLDVWTECTVQSSKATKAKKVAALQTENLEILCHVTESLSLICKVAAAGKFKQRITDEVIGKFPVEANKSSAELVSLNMNICGLFMNIDSEKFDEETSALVIDYVASILRTSKVQDLLQHMGTVTKVALILDLDLTLLDAGLLSLHHPEVDRYVCQVVQRSEVKGQRPELIKHIAKSFLSKKGFSLRAFEALIGLAKKRDATGLAEAFEDTLERLDAVKSPEVCKTLAIVLQDAPDTSKAKLCRHIQSLEDMDKFTRSFCVNTLTTF